MTLEHVSFSYNPEIKLLQDLNLNVKPGQKIAIVGPTGCGKTTLINLLMRFYDIQSGEIRVSNTGIQNITRDSLRANFGMVLQETWLKAGTIAENIAYGKRMLQGEKLLQRQRLLMHMDLSGEWSRDTIRRSRKRAATCHRGRSSFCVLLESC